MGYALFAQRKLVLDAELNGAQLQQTQRSDEQYALATQKLSLGQQLTSINAAQAGELADLYGQLADTTEEGSRDSINAQISQKQQQAQQEVDGINRQIYEVGVKEESIELEVKRLDTMVTALQKQLEAVEQAEGDAIDRATPNYNGVG